MSSKNQRKCMFSHETLDLLLSEGRGHIKTCIRRCAILMGHFLHEIPKSGSHFRHPWVHLSKKTDILRKIPNMGSLFCQNYPSRIWVSRIDQTKSEYTTKEHFSPFICRTYKRSFCIFMNTKKLEMPNDKGHAL